MSCPTNLIITNGDLAVDLINGPIIINDWRPQSPELIGEGVGQRYSPTVIDTLDLKGRDNTPDNLIREIRKLERLSVQAIEYHNSNWQASPVWIETQGRGESLTRYALLINGRIAEAENPFGQLFQNPSPGSTWDGVSFVFEHLNWADAQPFTGDDLLFNTTKIVSLITNGDMEDWTSPTDITSWSEAGTVEQNENLTYVDSGDYSAKLSAGGLIAQVLAVAVDDGYYYAKVRVYIVSGEAFIQLRDLSSGTALAIETVSGTGWKTVEVSAKQTLGGDIAVRVYVTGTSVAYFDSVEAGFLSGAVSAGEVTPATSIPISNKDVTAGLTHIYNYNAGTVMWSDNLITDEAIALGDVAVAGSATYFGISSSAINYGPFNNIVTSLSTVKGSATTYSWQYWNGSIWTGVANLSDDSVLDTLGETVVSWEPSSDWTAVILPGIGAPAITGLWVKATIASATPPNASCAVADSLAYTATQNYFTTDDIGGDIDSILKLLMEMKYVNTGAAPTTDRVIAGARSKNRGDFQSYINISDRGNIPGITVNANAGAFSDDVTYPTGRKWRYTFNGIVSSFGFEVIFDGKTALNYAGEYRVFAILTHVTGASDTMSMDFGYEVNGITTETGFESFAALVSDDHWVWDLGSLSISKPADGLSPSVRAYVTLANSAATVMTVDATALVLIPTDEWSGQFTIQDLAASSLDFGSIIGIDSLSYQGKQRDIYSYTKDENGKLRNGWVSRAGDSIKLSPINEDQTIHFLTEDVDFSSFERPTASPHQIHLATAENQDQYLLNRGDDVIGGTS